MFVYIWDRSAFFSAFSFNYFKSNVAIEYISTSERKYFRFLNFFQLFSAFFDRSGLLIFFCHVLRWLTYLYLHLLLVFFNSSIKQICSDCSVWVFESILFFARWWFYYFGNVQAKLWQIAPSFWIGHNSCT